MNIICPMMSRPEIDDIPSRNHDGDIENTRLFEVRCRKEKCALWIIHKDGDFCGLIRD